MRLARRQRSETCFLVIKEMIALGQWFAVTSSEIGEATGKGTEGEDDDGDKEIQTESVQAKWLKVVCREVGLFSCIKSRHGHDIAFRSRHSNAGERN